MHNRVFIHVSRPLTLAALILVACAVIAVCQSRPRITAVVSAADFQPGVTFSEYTTIFGTGLSDAVYQAQALPYPQKLGVTQVYLCNSAPVPLSQAQNVLDFLGCVPAALVYVSPSQVNLLIPADMPPKRALPGLDGKAVFVVSVAGVLDQDASAALPVTIDLRDPQPRIFTEGTDCLIDPRYQDRSTVCGLTFDSLPGNHADRGAITDLQGNLISSSNPTKLGGWYTIWLTGMGTFTDGEAPEPPTLVLTNVPVYGYPGDTWEYAEFAYAESPQFPGLYQVNFQVPVSIATGFPNWGYPPPFPCGNYNWEVSIDFIQAGNHANLVQIPIVVKVGDVPCKP